MQRATSIPIDPEALSNLHALLGIVEVEASADKVVLEVEVTSRVCQPFGILHGGVSALMAESAASLGGFLSAPEGKAVVGVELNASHLRSVDHGIIRATATPIRRGRTMQVWAITVCDAEGREVCAARCSLAVLDRPSGATG